jgi:hypothetical protein
VNVENYRHGQGEGTKYDPEQRDRIPAFIHSQKSSSHVVLHLPELRKRCLKIDFADRHCVVLLANTGSKDSTTKLGPTREWMKHHPNYRHVVG